MEIKGVSDIQRFSSSFSKGNIAKISTEIDNKQDYSESDTIKISPAASFQAKLDGYTKQYAISDGGAINHISSAQMSQLKAAYSGDRCPVSGSEIVASLFLTTATNFEPMIQA